MRTILPIAVCAVCILAGSGGFHRNFSHDRDIAQFYNLLAISYDQAEKQLNLVFSDGEEPDEIDSLDIRSKM